MSVFVHYEMTTVDKNGNPVNLKDALTANGVYDDSKGTINLDKANHDGWQQDLAKIKEKGVIHIGKQPTFGDCQYEYMKHCMDKPDVPDDRRFSSYDASNGKLGYYTRNANYDSDSSAYTEFPKDKVDEINKGAQQLLDSYKPEKDDYGTYYRRDYTDKEIESISNPSVNLTDKSMTYARNYDLGADYIAYHAGASMPGNVSKLVCVQEASLAYYCHWKDGKACTPDGKPFSTAFEITEKQLPKDFKPGQSYDSDVKLRMYMGDEQKPSAMYVKPDQIFKSESVYPGKYDVYLENKDYTVYSLADKTKSKMTPKEIVDENNKAKAAYRDGLKNKSNNKNVVKDVMAKGEEFTEIETSTPSATISK